MSTAPLCINHKPETRQALDALHVRQPTSEQSLEKCRNVIRRIPNYYTAWQMYFGYLKSWGERDSDGEKMVQKLLETSAKNYQLWNFRRQLYLHGMSSAEAELMASDVALLEDGKNYHAWAHRQMILEMESSTNVDDLWIEEKEVVEHMLQKDIFNNSAWTQRELVVRHLSAEEKAAEIDTVKESLAIAPHCVAGWNYLRHVLWSYAPSRVSDVVHFCIGILERESACQPCLEFLADIYFGVSNKCSAKKARHYRSTAVKIWRKCIEIDPIRSHYWTSRIASASNS